ncbi:MAG: carboxypeptidase-like regulatory domain-containing protein [Alistipes senegalensis]
MKTILRQALVLAVGSVAVRCCVRTAAVRHGTGCGCERDARRRGDGGCEEARSSGAITDSDGRYQIRIPEGGKTLLFSFVGYQTQEQVVAPGRTRLDVVLQPSSTEIEQVVVTGYSQTTVKKVTGSVGILTADELKLKPETSVDALMQGELAGVSVTPTTGRPGASQRTGICGIANLSGNTAPLWVVDGVPTQNEGPSTNLSSNELKAGGFDDIFHRTAPVAGTRTISSRSSC